MDVVAEADAVEHVGGPSKNVLQPISVALDGIDMNQEGFDLFNREVLPNASCALVSFFAVARLGFGYGIAQLLTDA